MAGANEKRLQPGETDLFREHLGSPEADEVLSCAQPHLSECPVVVRYLHLLDVLWHCSDMVETRIYYSLMFIVTLTTEAGAVSVQA